MTTYQLVKIIRTLASYSKNKVLALSFYETQDTTIERKRKTRVEFNSNLPPNYYRISVFNSIFTLEFFETQCDSGMLNPELLSKETYFDINSLEINNSNKNYIVHLYEEMLPFQGDTLELTETSSLVPDTQNSSRFVSDCLKTDANLYINIFRLLGEQISLTIKHKDIYYPAYYINGKLLVITLGINKITVHITDLYAITRKLPNYEIIDFIRYPQNLTIRTLLDKLEKFASNENFIFVKE